MGFARVINFKLTPLLPEPEPWPAHSYERAAATDRSCAQLYAKIRRHANSSDSRRRRACARLSATARCLKGQAFAPVSGVVGSALMVRARKLTEPLLCDISRVSEILLKLCLCVLINFTRTPICPGGTFTRLWVSPGSRRHFSV